MPGKMVKVSAARSAICDGKSWKGAGNLTLGLWPLGLGKALHTCRRPIPGDLNHIGPRWSDPTNAGGRLHSSFYEPSMRGELGVGENFIKLESESFTCT